MLKSIRDFFISLIEELLPRRNDYEIVSTLSTHDIHSLPRAGYMSGIGWIYPLFAYKHRAVKALIWELKYKENTRHLDTMAKMMFDEIVEEMSNILMFDSDARFILMPIPITAERRAHRGYNQSEYIAKSILENDVGHFLLYAPQWLEKIKETNPQSHSQSRQERMNNLTDCFRADPRVHRHYIILIDDVVTTGSTLSEAKKTLLNAGSRNVLAWTIAH